MKHKRCEKYIATLLLLELFLRVDVLDRLLMVRQRKTTTAHGFAFFISMAFLMVFLVCNSPALGKKRPPYPTSPVIGGVSFDFSSHRKKAPGSDNWAVTWGESGHQYAVWGDGGGIGGTNRRGRVSLGVARIEGGYHNWRGYNVWGGHQAENPRQFGGKSYAIIAVDGILYMWVSPGSGKTNFVETRLAFSKDRGRTWGKAKWAFDQSEKMALPAFLQFGQNNRGQRDNFIYIYTIRISDASALKLQQPGRIDLVRVTKKEILKRNAYEFFAGFDANQSPRWTKDILARKAVFINSEGVGWCLSVSYNPGLKRYLLCTEHTESLKGNLGIFDAPKPWGPWTTVAYYHQWGGFETVFYWNFANKWLGPDGTDFVLLFSGTKKYDALNLIKGKFSRKESP